MTRSAKLMVRAGSATRGSFGTRLAVPLTGILLAAAWSVPTAAGSAMQTYESELKRCSSSMPLPDGTTECDLEPYYVPCLGEFVVGEYHVAGRYQEFATPSGTAHLRDNWQVTSMLSGFSTGRSWYAEGTSPFSVNDGGGGTFSAAGSLTYKPLAGGPSWQEQFVTKFIQNAVGQVVVDSATSTYRCLGSDR
jgi:hypothetical protein